MPKRPLRTPTPVIPELNMNVDSDSDYSTYDSDPDNPVPREIRVAAAELHEAQEAQRMANEPVQQSAIQPIQAYVPLRANEPDSRNDILQMGNVVEKQTRKRPNEQNTVMLQADIFVLDELTEFSTKKFLDQALRTIFHNF